MPFRKGGRKLLLALGIFVLVLAAVWLSMPAWFPNFLRPIARRAGARFSSYERIGYQRFELHQLTFTNNTLRLQAEVVNAYVPSVWVSKLVFSHSSTMPEFVRVNHWTCEVLPSNEPPSPAYAKLQDVVNVLSELSRWMPAAELADGLVRSGGVEIPISNARWSQGTLESHLTLPKEASGQELKVVLKPAEPAALQITCEALNLDSFLAITTNREGFRVNSTGTWRSNRFEAAVSFGRTDALPQTATFQAPKIVVPAAMLKLPYYDDLTGSLDGQWRTGTFKLQIAATATPLPDQTNWPVAELKFQASGDTHSARVEQLNVQSPFLRASLTSPLDVEFTAPFVRAPARLNLAADLEKQHWLELSGVVTGTAEVDTATNQLPRVQLELSGAQIGNAKLKARSFDVSGRMTWPSVELTKAVARFQDGSEAVVAGGFDLQQKIVTNGFVKVDGSLAQAWLPPGYAYQSLAFEAKFDGPTEQLNHSGKLDLGNVSMARVKLASLHGTWDGKAKDVRHFSFEASATNAAIAAEGNLNFQTNGVGLGLSRFSLSTNGSPALELQQPARISYSSGGMATNGWTVDVNPLRLAGAAGAVNAQATIHWPEQGQFNFGLQHVPVGLLSEITPPEFRSFELGVVEGTGSWSNGPLKMRLRASATGAMRPGAAAGSSSTPAAQASNTRATENETKSPAQLLSTPLNVELDLRCDAQGLVLSNMVVTSPTSTVVVAHGSLPLTITPAGVSNLWETHSEAALDLQASVRPEAFFWQSVSDLAGIRLVDPSLDLNVSGTWRSPQGHVLARAREIVLQHSTLTNLDLSDLQVDLQVDRQRARLAQAQVLVQGQRVSLEGEIPLSESSWKQLLQKQLPNWHQATARLSINDAQLAAFAPLFPQVLAAQGELNVQLRLLPDADLEGAMTLRHARTRPLGNTAPIRDINVTMRFANRVLALENASANLSGAVIELTGRADLSGTNWMRGELPPFKLTLRGANVPLARQPEYIIRSDLDLAVVKTNDATPIVFGTAHLRDSFYLSDISALVPKKVSTPAARPPYFSIDNPTVSDWLLSVNVDGIRWLKVRTGLFNGEVTANLRLEGTLKDPIALGGLKVDSGLVRFPFANLQVQQGLVTLTSQDPYHPQLLVRASSKQFGYDIRTEVSGSIDSPVIQFTSNPPLSSEQILLMITSGQLPQGEFSLTPQQRAQTVALFLGRDLLSKLGFGDQSQERLTISSGEEVSVQNKPTYRVEYKIAPRWSVTGEYDRFGDFNAGLKWRVYSK